MPAVRHFRLILRLTIAIALAWTLVMASTEGVASATNSDDQAAKSMLRAGRKKVFLSPAYHTGKRGARGECKGKRRHRPSERQLARKAAKEMAWRDITGLKDRGFRVNIGYGSPTHNRAASNRWNARFHFPLHSNAEAGVGCKNTKRKRRQYGGWEIYRPGGHSKGLAKSIKGQLKYYTPARSDKICSISNCTAFSCLEELCATDARRSVYSESAFHTWNRGVTFLRRVGYWTEGVAWGVESFYD